MSSTNDTNFLNVLSTPITENSHFLTSAPLISLGRNFSNYSPSTIEHSYILFHEYIHYESFITWPFLCLNYFLKAFYSTLYILSNKYVIDISSFKNDLSYYYWLNNRYLFSTHFNKSSSGETLIASNIGTDILTEGYALLDYKSKVGTAEYISYSERVVDYLINIDYVYQNSIHAQAVKLLLNTSELIREDIKQSIPATNSSSSKDIFNRFFGHLPPFIVHSISFRAFGYSMALHGFDHNNLSWNSAYTFIKNNYNLVWDTYCDKISILYKDVLINRTFDEWKYILKYKDSSIIGIHCFMTITYQNMVNTLMPLIMKHKDQRLFGLTFCSTINILKIYEKIFFDLINQYNVPKLFDKWIPIPVIDLGGKLLEGLQLKVVTNKIRNFSLNWFDSFESWDDRIYLVGWFNLLFSSRIFEKLDNCEKQIRCPILEWVTYQTNSFKKQEIGNNDIIDFLNHFCKEYMAFNIGLKKTSNKFNPSIDFCCFYPDDQLQKDDTDLCYFNNFMQSTFRSPH